MQSFNTIERENQGRNPSKKSTTVPRLHELIAPHLDSYNAIRAINGGMGPGLLDLAVRDLDERDVQDPFGNSLKCKLIVFGFC
jgi:hypothetical protein